MTTSVSGHALALLVEHTEAAAFASMLHGAPTSLGFQTEESNGVLTFVAPGLDKLLFNRVLGLGLGATPTPSVIESMVDRYRAAGLRNFGIQLSPEARPSSLHSVLEACGLEIRDYWTKVYRPREPHVTVATDLRVERIDRTHAEHFGEVACTGFGLPTVLQPVLSAAIGRPNWYHYIAWDDAKPAAVAALFVREAVGWLGVAATLPEYRRRGAQGALMARRLLDGSALGCQWFVTETGQDRPDKPNPSFHNMLRTGFSVAYHRPNYMLPRV